MSLGLGRFRRRRAEGLLRHQIMNGRRDGGPADKAETERCLQRARDAGVPGWDRAGSYFPRTWILQTVGRLVEYLKTPQGRRSTGRSSTSLRVACKGQGSCSLTRGEFADRVVIGGRRPVAQTYTSIIV